MTQEREIHHPCDVLSLMPIEDNLSLRAVTFEKLILKADINCCALPCGFLGLRLVVAPMWWSSRLRGVEVP